MNCRLLEIRAVDPMTFKPLLGINRITAVLRNKSNKRVSFRISPAKPDLFVVMPDAAELPPNREMDVEFEIVQGFATFRWTTHNEDQSGTNGEKQHIFTVIVNSESDGELEQLELETTVDTSNGEKSVRAMAKTVAALQAKIDASTDPGAISDLSGNSKNLSDPETVNRLRSVNRKLVNQMVGLKTENIHLNHEIGVLKKKVL